MDYYYSIFKGISNVSRNFQILPIQLAQLNPIAIRVFDHFLRYFVFFLFKPKIWLILIPVHLPLIWITAFFFFRCSWFWDFSQFFPASEFNIFHFWNLSQGKIIILLHFLEKINSMKMLAASSTLEPGIGRKTEFLNLFLKFFQNWYSPEL